MEHEDITFESLRNAIRAASPAASAIERLISWVGSGRRLAYARDAEGRLEVFLVGAVLAARERSVRERLVHDTWYTLGGENLTANRLRLPDGDHYDAIGSTILLELLEKGYEDDADGAFVRTEPLIALALEPANAESAALTGLAGELLTLASLIKQDRDSSETFLDSWQGWGRSSRDFQLGSTGIEVKTSTKSASRHHVQGWYQLECGVAADGAAESALHLLSIGIQWLPLDGPGATIEMLVKEIAGSLPAARRADLMQAVRGYCGLRLLVEDDGTAGQVSLRRPFVSTYERLYDLQDQRIRLPRSADLAQFTHLVSDSVSFEIELPERVRGDRNPVVGLAAGLAAVLAESP